MKFSGKAKVGTRWWTKTVGNHTELDSDKISIEDDTLFPPYNLINRYSLERREEGSSIYQYLYIKGRPKYFVNFC